MRLSRSGFMAARQALKQLLSKKKCKSAGFDNFDNAIAELRAELLQCDPHWQRITFHLTDSEAKNQKRMTAIWILKSKHAKQPSIVEFGYLKTK